MISIIHRHNEEGANLDICARLLCIERRYPEIFPISIDLVIFHKIKRNQDNCLLSEYGTSEISTACHKLDNIQ
jgi:hypothetical protein